MLGERRRAESMSAMPDHPRLDHDPTRRRTERQGKCCGTTSTEPRAGIASLPAKAFPGVTGLLGGPHDLTNKALRPDRSAPSVANTAGSDMQVIVARIHSRPQELGISDGSGATVFSDILAKAPAGDFTRCSVTPTLPTKNARRQSALLSRLPRSVFLCSQPPTAKNAKSFDRMRFSSFAADATIRTANRTPPQRCKRLSRKKTSMPPCSRPSRVKLLRAGLSAALDGRCARRLRQRWSGRRNGAASDRTEEWQTGHAERTIIPPMSTREVRGR